MTVEMTTRTREEMLTCLGSTPDELLRLIKDREDDDLLQPSHDGGWGVVEILAHMRDWEEVFLDRFTIVASEENACLPVQDDELWPIERDYRGQRPGTTLEEFRSIRKTMTEFLKGLPLEAWDRPARHESYGAVTLHWLVGHVCAHDREHLEQARDALA